MQRLFTYGLMALLLQSCIKEVPLKSTVVVEPQPVFHMYLMPDSFLFADFSRVTSITEKSMTTDNALISLYQNNNPIGDMTALGNGRYKAISNPFQPRDSFRIYGSDGVYSFFVRGRIPSKVKISQVDTQTLLIPGLGPAFALDVAFTDSAIDDNFYRMYLFKYFVEYKLDKSGNRIDSSYKKRILEINGSELPFIQNNFNNYTSSELLFSDATFNGTKAKFRVYTTDRLLEGKEMRNLKLEVVLENLEKPLFDFYNTRNAHVWQQQSISQLPGIIEGNITGGFGVGGAFTREILPINLH